MDGGGNSGPPGWQADPGTSAVVHGMLATMAEVLERLEDRLSTLEANVVGQTTATRTAAQRLATELPDAVIEPLRDRLEALDGLNARLAGVEEAVARPDTSALETRIDALAETMGAPSLVEARLQALAEAVAGRALETHIDALAEAVTALPTPDTSAIEARIDSLTAAVDGLPAPDIATLEARLDALAEAVSALPTPDTSGLEARLEALANAVHGLPTPDTSELEARLDALAGAVHGLPTPDNSAVEAQLAALAGAIDGLPRPDTSALEARIDALAEALDAIPAPDTAPIETRLDALAHALEARIDGLPRPDTSALEARIDALAEALDRRPPPDTSALEARIDGLAGAVAATQVSPGVLAAEVRAAVAETMAEAQGALLDERLAAVTAGIAELLTTAGAPPADPTAVALNLARLEADLAEARAESTMAAHTVVERVEEALIASRATDEELLRRAVGAVEAVVAHTQANAQANGNVPKADESLARLARIESLITSRLERDEARVTALTSELQSTLGAGLERLLTHATAHDDQVAAEVRSSLGRLSEVATGLDSLSSTITGMAEAVTRLAADDRGRTVLAAVESASREQQDALNSLQTSLVRRIDGRTAALAHKVDAIDIERLATDLTAALHDEHRRLETVQSLCQSVVGAVEQQAAVGSRVAELVLETRSAMRSDVERLESGLHLDSVKRQQHDQARMAQVAAGVTEVVERETALVAQRVAALAATVEALRNALHVNIGADGMAAAGT